MTRSSKLCLACMLFAVQVWVPGEAAAQFVEPPPPAAYVLEGVTVVQVNGRRIEGATVVVRNGLIEAIGKGIEAPPDAQVLEGDSLFVYPGIVDAEGKAAFKFPEVETKQNEIRSWNPPRTAQSFLPHLSVADYLTAKPADLKDQRKKGVVAAAVHPSGRLMPGRGAALLFRTTGDVPEDLILNPQLGPVMTLRGARGVYPSTLFAVLAFYRQQFENARHLSLMEAAYRKDPRGMTMPRWDPDLQVLEDVLSGRSRVFFQADLARDIQRVIRLSKEYGFQPVIVGGDEAWKVADELKAAAVPVLVSLDFPKPQRWKPKKKGDGKKAEAEEEKPQEPEELDAAALREKERIENIYRNAGRLAQAGVEFALTSGGGKADILEGARKAIEYGLDPDRALQAITETPARVIGAPQLARIDKGMPATFIVTSGRLFDEDTKVAYTFVEGGLEKGAKARKKTGNGEAAQVDVSGTWEVEVESEGGSFSLKLVVTQEGNGFKGSVDTEFGSGSVKDGNVSGKSITFVVSMGAGGQTFEINFTGTVEGDQASGSGDSEQGSFSWTAHRTGGGPGEEN